VRTFSGRNSIKGVSADSRDRYAVAEKEQKRLGEINAPCFAGTADSLRLDLKEVLTPTHVGNNLVRSLKIGAFEENNCHKVIVHVRLF